MRIWLKCSVIVSSPLWKEGVERFENTLKGDNEFDQEREKISERGGTIRKGVNAKLL